MSSVTQSRPCLYRRVYPQAATESATIGLDGGWLDLSRAVADLHRGADGVDALDLAQVGVRLDSATTRLDSEAPDAR